MKLILNNKYLKTGVLASAIIVCSMPLFVKLGTAPIYMWDEATYANNALDMYLANDAIVVRMEGQPDLYNTKPPFVLWMQTISLHLFGWNEWAIRLPSAVFALLTMCLLLWFSMVVLENALIGIMAMFTLASANGFIAVHVARSGDPDATLVWWTTLYTLVFLKFLLKPGNPKSHFLLIALGLSGAFLTKGIAGWFLLPLMVITALLHGNFWKLLRLKETYIAGLAVLFVAAGYYLLREKMAPGYWTVVYHSEILRFNNAVMSWHVQPYYFYLLNMIQGRFTPFFYVLPFTLLAFWMERDSIIRQCLIYLWILSLGYMLLISYPADKLEWYDAPMYPQLSLLIAIFCNSLIRTVTEVRMNNKLNRLVLRGFLATSLFLLFAVPYQQMVQRVLEEDDITYAWDHSQLDEFRITGAFMKFLKEKNPNLKEYTILKSPPADPEHYDQFLFYKRTYELKDQYVINLKNHPKDLQRGEKVLICEKPLMDSVQRYWSTTPLQAWKDCRLDSIEGVINNALDEPANIQ